jgi:hypothetical protein
MLPKKLTSLSSIMLKTVSSVVLSYLLIYSQNYQDFSTKISYPWQMDIAKKKNKTIIDYFYLLPGGFLDCDGTHHYYPTFSERKKLLTHIDEKNGYIESVTIHQMALFKNKKESIDILVLQTGKSGAGSSCGSLNQAFQYIPEKYIWIERSDLFPSGYNHEELYNKYSEFNLLPFFKLPRKGLIIEIADEAQNDSVIGTLQWDGGKFNIFSDIQRPE